MAGPSPATEQQSLRPLQVLRRETFITLAAAAVVWQLLALATPDYIIPGWPTIGRSLWTLLSTRPGWIALTVARVLVSLGLAFFLGMAAALTFYLHTRWERYLMPLVRIVMAVPVICWVLFAVLWFRGVEFQIGWVLVVVGAPIFLTDLLDSLKGIPGPLSEMVQSFRPTRTQTIRKLLLPSLTPVILTSWKVNLSLAIRVVTIAELVGATSGIGYGLQVAQSEFSIADIFAWTLILVVILMLTQQLVTVMELRALRWREVS